MLSPLRIQIFATMTSDLFESIVLNASSSFDEPGMFEEMIEGIENLIAVDRGDVQFSKNQYMLAAARLLASDGDNTYMGVMSDYAACVARALEADSRSTSDLVDAHRFTRSKQALSDLSYDLGLLTECVQRSEYDKTKMWLVDIAARLVGFSL